MAKHFHVTDPPTPSTCGEMKLRLKAKTAIIILTLNVTSVIAEVPMELSCSDINLFLNLPRSPRSPVTAPGGPLTHITNTNVTAALICRGNVLFSH